ncbi:MAG: hypothetical protein ACXVPU_09125 [Bacteroidia bacterium]
MEEKDYSKEIFEKYYGIKDRILEILLNDDTILEGILVSFFHGDPDSETYIVKWHFIDKNEISKYLNEISIDGSEEFGRIIMQEDIKSVKFKI